MRSISAKRSITCILFFSSWPWSSPDQVLSVYVMNLARVSLYCVRQSDGGTRLSAISSLLAGRWSEDNRKKPSVSHVSTACWLSHRMLCYSTV
ncbi:hypothetical protein F5141DRAFT_1106906 [Pisolithus sp. B1]|nr:hypothetical protein F5141DRAFT_1106906 [Pisolithus sp. B1]